MAQTAQLRRVDSIVSDAQPVLGFAPSHIETGVAYDGTVSETITLDNRGLAALNDVTLALLALDDGPAPAWVQLVSGTSQGNIEVGEKRPITISFSPTSASAAPQRITSRSRLAGPIAMVKSNCAMPAIAARWITDRLTRSSGSSGSAGGSRRRSTEA